MDWRPLRLHQPLEQPVAEDKNILGAVEGLAEAEQLHRGAERSDQLVDGGTERFGRID